MAEGRPAERLRVYLAELTPQARALLLAELERSAARGEAVPGADLILPELRRLFRNSSFTAERVGNPARLFFAPLEPFLIDDAEHHYPGRIARAALDPI